MPLGRKLENQKCARLFTSPDHEELRSNSSNDPEKAEVLACYELAGDLLLRQRIPSFDEAPHELSGFRRSQILPLLNPLRVIGKIRILHRVAKPA